MPALSVILPTHNRADELPEAAASVLGQVDDVELIVVDDGSADHTPTVVDALCRDEARIKAVRNEQALGLSGARNTGLRLASSDVVGFCDDDDRWMDGVARALLGCLEAHPDAGAVSCWHQVYHRDSGSTALYRGPALVNARQFLWQNLVGIPFAFIRRSSFEAEIAYDPAMITGEDWDLWVRMARERPVRVVGHVGYRYTQHGNNRLTTNPEKQIAGRRAFLAKHGDAMSSACRDYHRAVIADLAGGRHELTRELRRELSDGPRGAAVVAATVLGAGFVASRVGVRRGDPGLQARMAARLIERLDRS